MIKRSTLRIGRREFTNLPELNVQGIEAKIDTGAYTSALHCSSIRAVKKNGGDFVEFMLLDDDHPQFTSTIHSLPIKKRKRIRSSNGTTQLRYIIETQIEIGGVTINTEFSLSNRSAMTYPLLIGRKTLKKHFIIDVDLIHTGGIPLIPNQNV
ncbi:MAG: RimK/LysX family protein [Balneolales bacterium]|nr:RimK/LysX family protein [Balneolales bacterium]